MTTAQKLRLPTRPKVNAQMEKNLTAGAQRSYQALETALPSEERLFEDTLLLIALAHAQEQLMVDQPAHQFKQKLAYWYKEACKASMCYLVELTSNFTAQKKSQVDHSAHETATVLGRGQLAAGVVAVRLQHLDHAAFEQWLLTGGELADQLAETKRNLIYEPTPGTPE